MTTPQQTAKRTQDEPVRTDNKRSRIGDKNDQHSSNLSNKKKKKSRRRGKSKTQPVNSTARTATSDKGTSSTKVSKNDEDDQDEDDEEDDEGEEEEDEEEVDYMSDSDEVIEVDATPGSSNRPKTMISQSPTLQHRVGLLAAGTKNRDYQDLHIKLDLDEANQVHMQTLRNLEEDEDSTITTVAYDQGDDTSVTLQPPNPILFLHQDGTHISGSPMSLYQQANLVQNLLWDPNVFTWVLTIQRYLNRNFYSFESANSIHAYYSSDLSDVLYGMAKLHITEPFEFQIEEGVIDSKIVSAEFENPEDDPSISHYGNGFCIPQEDWNKDRFLWRRQNDATRSATIKAMETVRRGVDFVVNKARLDGEASIMDGQGELFLTHIDEVIFDNEESSHIANRYSEFNKKAVYGKLNKTLAKPMTVLYAVDPFTLIVYPRPKSFLGDEVGTRIYVPKNCAVFVRFDLPYSDDHWKSDFQLCDEDKKSGDEVRGTNFRFRGHVIPHYMTVRRRSGLAIDPSIQSPEHMFGVIGHAVDLVVYVPIHDIQRLWDQIEFHQNRNLDDIQSHSRLGKVIGMMLMLQEYIAQSREVRYLDVYDNLRRPMDHDTDELVKAKIMYEQYLWELVSYTIEKLSTTVQIRIRKSGSGGVKDWWYPENVKIGAAKKKLK